MNAQELAARLDGREYGSEITKEEAAEAKAAGLVVVYGYSDDNMEFDGAFRDEFGCYGGGTAYLAATGLLQNDCDCDDCPHFARLKNSAPTIKAVWDRDGYSWIYETAIPHATFEIVDGGEKYCRGIVFALADINTQGAEQ